MRTGEGNGHRVRTLSPDRSGRRSDGTAAAPAARRGCLFEDQPRRGWPDEPGLDQIHLAEPGTGPGRGFHGGGGNARKKRAVLGFLVVVLRIALVSIAVTVWPVGGPA